MFSLQFDKYIGYKGLFFKQKPCIVEKVMVQNLSVHVQLKISTSIV